MLRISAFSNTWVWAIMTLEDCLPRMWTLSKLRGPQQWWASPPPSPALGSDTMTSHYATSGSEKEGGGCGDGEQNCPSASQLPSSFCWANATKHSTVLSHWQRPGRSWLVAANLDGFTYAPPPMMLQGGPPLPLATWPQLLIEKDGSSKCISSCYCILWTFIFILIGF